MCATVRHTGRQMTSMLLFESFYFEITMLMIQSIWIGGSIFFMNLIYMLPFNLYALISFLSVFCIIALFTFRVQPIFDWIFEVEEGATDSEDSGRIILSLEYEMNSNMQETYGNVENRVVARLHIQQDDVICIVPVIKVCIVRDLDSPQTVPQIILCYILSVWQ